MAEWSADAGFDTESVQQLSKQEISSGDAELNFANLLLRVRRNPLAGFGLAVLLVAVALLLRLTTPLTLTYVTFYPAVIAATVAGGWLPGLLAMLLSTCVAIFFFVDPVRTIIFNAQDVWNAGAFWIVCILIIALTNNLVDLLIRVKAKAEALVVLNQKLATSEEQLGRSVKQQHVLMRELSHRMKNQYSVIVAMARVAGTDTASVSEFQEAFADRLRSMSRAHDLLTQRDWKPVPLRDLISAEVEAFSQKDRLELHGEDLWLKEHAVVNLGMALHELATNATKHGAWSGANGKVVVIWTITDGNLLFRWREVDGPSVSRSNQRGFGSKMLEKIVPIALEGKGTLDFTPQGLCWTLEVPTTCLGGGSDRS